MGVFIPFILVATFSVVNLLAGLIVNSMQDIGNKEAACETTHYRDDVLACLGAIEKQLDALAKRN